MRLCGRGYGFAVDAACVCHCAAVVRETDRNFWEFLFFDMRAMVFWCAWFSFKFHFSISYWACVALRFVFGVQGQFGGCVCRWRRGCCIGRKFLGVLRVGSARVFGVGTVLAHFVHVNRILRRYVPAPLAVASWFNRYCPLLHVAVSIASGNWRGLRRVSVDLENVTWPCAVSS